MEATPLAGILTEIFITIQLFFVGLKVEVKKSCIMFPWSRRIWRNLQTIVLTWAKRHCEACWQRIDLWSKADHCIRHLAHHVARTPMLKMWNDGFMVPKKLDQGNPWCRKRFRHARRPGSNFVADSTGCCRQSRLARQRWSGEVRISWTAAGRLDGIEPHFAWRSQVIKELWRVGDQDKTGDWPQLLKHRKIWYYRNSCLPWVPDFAFASSMAVCWHWSQVVSFG